MKQMSTNYFLAIKRYPDSLVEIKKEIWTGFYHMISTDDAPQYEHCNLDWCKYLKIQANNEPFKHKPALNAEVQECIKPIFKKLTNDDLLRRWLGKNIQNNIKCYDKTLWTIVSKHTFLESRRIRRPNIVGHLQWRTYDPPEDDGSHGLLTPSGLLFMNTREIRMMRG